MEAKKNGIDETICRAATETQTGRTDLCTKLGKEKEGCLETQALGWRMEEAASWGWWPSVSGKM